MLADARAAPAVRTALAQEVRDPRTWETQYQMIMALGATGDEADVQVLKALALDEREATMVNMALGDALVRLGGWQSGTRTTLDWCLDQSVDLLDDGALRAVAMLRLPLDQAAVERILNHVKAEEPQSHLRFWPSVAAAGWQGPCVRQFLETCAAGPRADVAEAAALALQGRYTKVSPL